MSVALEEWDGPSREALDEIELVHARVGGTGVGRRILTRQVNYAYAALILAHFQRYCRSVHTEATDALVASIPDPNLIQVFAASLTERRLLDRGNPTPENLSRDFARFGFRLWPDLEVDDRRNWRRRQKLEELCRWRNAITHGDIPQKRAAGQLVPRDLNLDTCRDWRRALRGLATSIDEATAARCQVLGRPKPW
jgi:hypothetical protein